jgi:hypothetical protein
MKRNNIAPKIKVFGAPPPTALHWPVHNILDEVSAFNSVKLNVDTIK